MIPCLYTTQRSKKVKAWHDGYIKYNTDKKSVLFDYEQKVIMRFNLKEIKEEINAGIYLINIEDINKCKEEVINSKIPLIITDSNNNINKEFEVPINNKEVLIRKNINTINKKEIEVIKIPIEKTKRIITEEEAGFVIKKRVNNIIMCLKEYIKIMDITNPSVLKHKLIIEDLQNELKVFKEKHERYLSINKSIIESQEINKEKESDLNGRTNNEIFHIIDD